MRLKKLSLQGYKTFASKTEFLFDDGITAVVGPNGSGKSNVADAVRWVLGEQSYSMLRGKRTTDMIFAGSQSRARAGMAQAILTLDNSAGWLPIDYTEVEIGRRAHRSGENEYLLNGQRVRLRDVTDLLATSGLAERTYTIIGQGLIDQALSLRAEERRALFEEAAGISHYKTRRAETVRRLEETRHNLERVHDILAEIRPRLRSLAQQASRARNYEQIENDLRHLLRIWHGYRWEEAKERLRRQRQRSAEAERLWQTGRRQLATKQEELERRRQQFNELQKQLRRKQAERETLREETEEARRQTVALNERQLAWQRQITEIEAELPHLEGQQETALAELDQAAAALETAQQQLAEAQTEKERFQATFQSRQAVVEQQRQQAEKLEKEQQAGQKRLAQAEGQLSQLQERLQEKDHSPQENDAALAGIDQEIERLAALCQSAQEQRQERRQKRDALQAERQAAIRELKKLRREAEEINRQMSQYNNLVARQQARCEFLEQARHKEAPAVDGTAARLASQLTIPAEYRTAVEAALGHRLATLILTEEEALWTLIREAPATERLALLTLPALAPDPSPPMPAEEGIIDWAANLVACPPPFRPAAQYLLGRILLAQDRETAYRLAGRLPAGCLAVALDGFVAHAGGLVEIGARDPQQSILAREEAWRQAVAELAEAQRHLEEEQAKAAGHQAEIERRQREVDEQNETDRRLGRLEAEAEQRLAKAERELDRAQQQRLFRQKQQEQEAAELARLQERIVHLQRQIEQEKERAAQLDLAVMEARQQVEDLPLAEAKQERQAITQQVEAAQTILAGRQAVVDSRRVTLNQIEGQLRQRQQRLGDLRRRLAEANRNLDESQQTLAEATAALAQLETAITPLQERLEEEQGRLADLETEISRQQRQAHELESRHTQNRMELNQRESQLEGLRERIRADLGLVALSFDDDQVGQTPLPMSDVVDTLPVVAELPEDIEESIQRYRGQLHRMGAINPDAPAEYEETQQRYDFLNQQIEDLNRTEQQLRRIIAELDELTSRAFGQTVERVNEHFGQTFTRLFGGGSARLLLTDPDDLTVSGVDIVAQLPGRRQQNLGLLSGGERSLTAVALIFALLKVAPTPFCILDEVDAMLDEANVERFRELLRELSAHTQFIIITHNRGTVQAAQTVYGISMGSDSASQVISIKPGEYGEEAG